MEEITNGFSTIGELNQIKEMTKKVNSSKLRNINEVQADLTSRTCSLKTRFLQLMATINHRSPRKEVTPIHMNSKEVF
jgi:hypothetical protein|tara:strand:+ start:254 stop:487 length:234 start_codon:yes stop_codon:yes gene_type:complete